MDLIKVTLAYCPHEDRVRMDGQGSTAGTIRIWFTARLLSFLTAPREICAANGGTRQPDHEHKPDMLKTDDKDESAVILEHESPEVLIHTVDEDLLQ